MWSSGLCKGCARCVAGSSMNCLRGTPCIQLVEDIKPTENVIALALRQAPVLTKVPPQEG